MSAPPRNDIARASDQLSWVRNSCARGKEHTPVTNATDHADSVANRARLSTLRVAELQELAASLGIAGASKRRKGDLVELISNHQEASAGARSGRARLRLHRGARRSGERAAACSRGGCSDRTDRRRAAGIRRPAAGVRRRAAGAHRRAAADGCRSQPGCGRRRSSGQRAPGPPGPAAAPGDECDRRRAARQRGRRRGRCRPRAGCRRRP